MKKKLRKIIIADKNYLYSVKYDYGLERFDVRVTLIVYLEGFKHTPLKVHFFINSYFSGIPLKLGITLTNQFTHSADEINLNKPATIRQFIELALQEGWQGDNAFTKQDGLLYLQKMGYDIDILLPQNFSTLVAKQALFNQALVKPEEKPFTSASEIFGFTPASSLYIDEDIPRLSGLPRTIED